MEFHNCTCNTAKETGEHCHNCISRRMDKPCDCILSYFGRGNRDGH